jgi:hypothetical protein
VPAPTLTREVEAGSLVSVRIDGQDPDHRLVRPLAVIHRRHQQLGLTAARFLKLLTEEGDLASPARGPALASGGAAAAVNGGGGPARVKH